MFGVPTSPEMVNNEIVGEANPFKRSVVIQETSTTHPGEVDWGSLEGSSLQPKNNATKIGIWIMSQKSEKIFYEFRNWSVALWCWYEATTIAYPILLLNTQQGTMGQWDQGTILTTKSWAGC